MVGWLGRVFTVIATLVFVCLGLSVLIGMILAIFGGAAGIAGIKDLGRTMVLVGILPTVALLFSGLGDLGGLLPGVETKLDSSSGKEEKNSGKPTSLD